MYGVHRLLRMHLEMNLIVDCLKFKELLKKTLPKKSVCCQPQFIMRAGYFLLVKKFRQVLVRLSVKQKNDVS